MPTTYPTCHPRRIQAKASEVVRSLLCDNVNMARSIEDVAKAIYSAGIATLEYTRTVALLAHSVLMELRWRNWGAYKLLRDELVDLVASSFINGWMDEFRGVDDDESCHDTPPTILLMITVFFGDLFAMGIVPTPIMQSGIIYLANNLSLINHYRGLYVLLERASSYFARPLGMSFLLQCRALAVRNGTLDGMTTEWLIDIYSVVDVLNAMLAQESDEPHLKAHSYNALACHRWDRNLSCDPLFKTFV